MTRRILAFLLACAAAFPIAPGRAAEPSAFDHLRDVVGLSHAPDYRRAGSPGMAAVANYVAGTLGGSGYTTIRHDFTFRRWVVDYAAGHEPSLVRVGDGRAFKTESAFNLGATTGTSGIQCTVRAVTQVRPGDCGFVPFGNASPEWKNSPFVTVSTALANIVAKGGVGAVVQGDVARDLVYALSARVPIPVVVAVAGRDELLGRRVQLRAMGSFLETAPGHNVIGVRRPPAGSSSYIVLLAHADGWFQAAADNGSGLAAILRAARALADTPPDAGVIVAAMDAEEVGLVGAERFVDALVSPGGMPVGDGGPPLRLDDVKAVVNLDASSARASDVQNAAKALVRRDVPVFQWRAMVFSEEPVVAAAGLGRFAAHGVLGLPVPASVFRPVGSGSLDGKLRSDVHWFAVHGVPFFWPVAGYPEYHTDGDTLAAVDANDLEAVALAAADLVRDYATLPIGRVAAPFTPAA